MPEFNDEQGKFTNPAGPFPILLLVPPPVLVIVIIIVVVLAIVNRGSPPQSRDAVENKDVITTRTEPLPVPRPADRVAAISLLPDEMTAAARNLFQTLCAGPVTTDVDGESRRPACSPCPNGWPEGMLILGSAEFGRFTSTSRISSVLSTAGCEPHSAGFGGSAFFTMTNGTWRLNGYLPGLRTFNCKKLEVVDGRQALVCRDNTMNQGVIIHSVHVVEFTSDPDGSNVQAQDMRLVDVMDTTATGFSPVHKSSEPEIEVRDLNVDGFQDIVVTFRYGKIEVAPDKVDGVSEDTDMPIEVGTTPYTLRFLYSAEARAEHGSFRPDAATRRIIPQLGMDEIPPRMSFRYEPLAGLPLRIDAARVEGVSAAGTEPAAVRVEYSYDGPYGKYDIADAAKAYDGSQLIGLATAEKILPREPGPNLLQVRIRYVSESGTTTYEGIALYRFGFPSRKIEEAVVSGTRSRDLFETWPNGR